MRGERRRLDALMWAFHRRVSVRMLILAIPEISQPWVEKGDSQDGSGLYDVRPGGHCTNRLRSSSERCLATGGCYAPLTS